MACGKIGKRIVIEDSCNRIANRTHYLLHGTTRLIRIGTIAAFLVCRLTDTPDRCEGTIEYAYDLTECDLVRLFNKDVSSVHPTSAGDEPGSFEHEKNLLQEFNGDVLPSGDIVTLQRRLPVNERELKQRPETIFTFFREFHKIKVSLSTTVTMGGTLMVCQGQSSWASANGCGLSLFVHRRARRDCTVLA